MGWRKSGIQTRHGGESNRKRWHTCQSLAMTGQMDEMMLHIHLVIHIPSWSVYSNGVEKEWNTHIYSELKINNIFNKCHQIRNKIK
jgi:hypothetical protein